jgi:hypothetical protein
MNETKPTASAGDEESGRGPNLTLIYTLIVLAMIAALVVAAFIVLPFYQRR